MKFTKLALTFLCSAVLFCGCTKDSDAVIKINDQVVTKAEFYDDYNKIRNVQFKNAPREIQNETSYPSLALKDNYVNNLIVRKLLAQEFEKRKITASIWTFYFTYIGHNKSY